MPPPPHSSHPSTASTQQQQQQQQQQQGNTTVTSSQNNMVQSGGDTYRLPSALCMQHVFKLAIVEDKPIMMDYWTSSLDKTVVIGVRENNEKLIVKSADEYTSPIAKIYKVETEYIIVTENSIYIVASDIANKRIS